jgi:hypothetical protein
MKHLDGITLDTVRQVYGGAEGDLWELVMGRQIHIGGFASSMALADHAGIHGAAHGVDLCCCSGEGMRFLVRHRAVAAMTGVDATDHVIERGRARSASEVSCMLTMSRYRSICRAYWPVSSAASTSHPAPASRRR